MNQLIANFAHQLSEALTIGEQAQVTPAAHPIHNVLASGLGGSGIGGSIVLDYVYDKLNVPFTVNKDYFLPAFVGPNTLVIISSYSGNTEETVAVLERAIACNAKIMCVTSGGKVAEMAKAHNLDLILIPGGNPPRSCLGYSLVQIMYTLFRLNLVNDAFIAEFQAAIALINQEETAIKAQAESLAKSLADKIPVIYSISGFEGVAVRFRQQVNENGKMLCWHNVIPEMNHNELVGWRSNYDNLAVIIFRNNSDYSRSVHRVEVNKEVIRNYTPNIYEIHSKGASYWENAIYLVHLGDWISWYLAQERQVDVMEVKVIDHLKSSLQQLDA
jgi:glucose/mannose-6-phosphate isomerase